MFRSHQASLPLMAKEEMIELCAECERFTASSDIEKFGAKLKSFKMTRDQKRVLADILLEKYIKIFAPPAENKIFPDLVMRRYDSQFYGRRPREGQDADFVGIKWAALAAALGNITAVGICDRVGRTNFYDELYDLEQSFRNVETKRGDVEDAMIGEAYMSQDQLIRVLVYIRNITRDSNISTLLDDLTDLRIKRAERNEIGDALLIRLIQIERGFDECRLEHLTYVSLWHITNDCFLSQLLAVTAAFGQSSAIKMADGIDLKYERSAFILYEEQERSRCLIF